METNTKIQPHIKSPQQRQARLKNQEKNTKETRSFLEIFVAFAIFIQQMILIQTQKFMVTK